MNWLLGYLQRRAAQAEAKRPLTKAETLEALKKIVDAALESEGHKIPPVLAKEFALLKVRLDRLELLTGLKREPEAIHVKGTARIE